MTAPGHPIPGAVQVFVYYRVRTADVASVIAAAQALQIRLQALMPGLACTLSRRAEDAADLHTLMETYAHVDGVGPAWQRDIERLALDRLSTWVVGPRHVELFVPCA